MYFTIENRKIRFCTSSGLSTIAAHLHNADEDACSLSFIHRIAFDQTAMRRCRFVTSEPVLAENGFLLLLRGEESQWCNCFQFAQTA